MEWPLGLRGRALVSFGALANTLCPGGGTSTANACHNAGAANKNETGRLRCDRLVRKSACVRIDQGR